MANHFQSCLKEWETQERFPVMRGQADARSAPVYINARLCNPEERALAKQAQLPSLVQSRQPWMTRPACPGLHDIYLLQTGSQTLLPLWEQRPQFSSQASFTEAAARPPWRLRISCCFTWEGYTGLHRDFFSLLRVYRWCTYFIS